MPSALQMTVTDTLMEGMKRYFKTAGISQLTTIGADKKAKTVCGLQFINFVVNGSSKETVTPPIKWGNLRAAGSVHVGREFVGGNNLYPVKEKTGEGANIGGISEKPDTITIGFNTSYATKLHETEWNPGPASKKAGNVGNKYLEKHLVADRETVMQLYAETFKKETGG